MTGGLMEVKNRPDFLRRIKFLVYGRLKSTTMRLHTYISGPYSTPYVSDYSLVLTLQLVRFSAFGRLH